MALRDFFVCLFCFYRRFLENRNLKEKQTTKQKLKINDKKKIVNEYVYTEKLKGEKQIGRQIYMKQVLKKILRFPGKKNQNPTVPT